VRANSTSFFLVVGQFGWHALSHRRAWNYLCESAAADALSRTCHPELLQIDPLPLFRKRRISRVGQRLCRQVSGSRIACAETKGRRAIRSSPAVENRYCGSGAKQQRMISASRRGMSGRSDASGPSDDNIASRSAKSRGARGRGDLPVRYQYSVAPLAYPKDVREQFLFIRELTIGGHDALRQLGIHPITVPTAVT
jgi:hypothetical protein